MRNRYSLIVLTLAVIVAFATAEAQAQLYAAEEYPGFIRSFELSYNDTTGTVVNPSGFISYVSDVSVDQQGRLLLLRGSSPNTLSVFDNEDESLTTLFTVSSGWNMSTVEAHHSSDVYFGCNSEALRVIDGWIGVLEGGLGGAADSAYIFYGGERVIDIQTWPTGTRAGNVLALIEDDGYYIVEFERESSGALTFVQTIASGGMMPSDPTAIGITPDGTILVLDFVDGLFYIEEYYGYVWGFGTASGPGLSDLEVGADGRLYVCNVNADRVERYTSTGSLIPPYITDGIVSLGAIGVTGYTPTPEGSNVFVEPGENIEVTYETVTSSGFTIAEVTTTTSRISPEGNPLPDHAVLPGGRATDFSYILLATDAVYEGLIQVDVLEEGERLFYASGVSDTFRDFTVVGSIEDARGTIPRFEELPYSGGSRVETGPTEVVLVDDTRALSDVTKYKFWRLELAMEVPDNMPGSDPCPWEFIKWLQKYPESARDYYDVNDYTNALSELAIMNSMIRSHAGWCIPDSSDDPQGNLVGHILAHAKTLMYSIGLEAGIVFTGIEEVPSTVSLAVTSPARGECSISLSGPVGTEVAVRIYSVSGRLVATVYEGQLPEGGETIVWNGVDSGGRPVASGVYFARVESDGRPQVSKVVYIR
jgi:hypothetical protein